MSGKHGAPPSMQRHVGDMGNITSSDTGTSSGSIMLGQVRSIALAFGWLLLTFATEHSLLLTLPGEVILCPLYLAPPFSPHYTQVKPSVTDQYRSIIGRCFC
jgi:hypothetical protein